MIQQLQGQVQKGKQEIQEVVDAADVMEKEFNRKQTQLEKEIREARE